MKPIDIARIEVCRAKQRFLTRKEAAMVIKAQRERRNPAPGKIEPYRCDLCGGWHLTDRSKVAAKGKWYRPRMDPADD